jgi:hypothetical protein
MRYKSHAQGPPHLVELALQVERDGADRGGVRQRRVLAVVHHAADRREHDGALTELDAPLRRRRVWLLQRAPSVTEHKPAPHKHMRKHACMARDDLRGRCNHGGGRSEGGVAARCRLQRAQLVAGTSAARATCWRQGRAAHRSPLQHSWVTHVCVCACTRRCLAAPPRGPRLRGVLGVLSRGTRSTHKGGACTLAMAGDGSTSPRAEPPRGTRSTIKGYSEYSQG